LDLSAFLLLWLAACPQVTAMLARVTSLALCAAVVRASGDSGAAQAVPPQGEGSALRGSAPSSPLSSTAVVQDLPSWCRFVPDLFKGIACTGGGPGKSPPTPLPPVHGTVPAWCQFVPSEYQSAACRGSGAGCLCSDWCSATPLISQQWNPECCACEGSSPTPVPPNRTGAGNRTVPAWCQFVPSDFKREACRGSGPGCKCSDWCSATPSWSQEWNPECCGCIGDSPTPSPPSPPSPPSQDDTQNGTVPAWCRFVPEDDKKDACRGSGPGCKCLEWCSATPSFSQQWNPECCGCVGGSPLPSQNSTEVGMVPAWCQFVPSDYKSQACRGTGPGCKCSDWCDATPNESQKWNPECCGCSGHSP